MIFEEDRELEYKVHDTLKRHADYWREMEASSFAISLVESGYVPQLRENPPRYEEIKEMLYRKERLWAKEAVCKLERAKLVREVKKEEWWCINPLASNSKGKMRLCLDLCRCVNQVINALKFRIESTMASLQVIEKDDYLLSFDLKSPYLQLIVYENFLQYFGFGIEEDNG